MKSDESQYSAPTPEEGKALIYFVADGHLTSPFGVDGKWVGAVRRYFIVAIDPGEHHICAMLQSFLPLRGPKVSVHSLKARVRRELLLQDSHGRDQQRVRSSTRPVGFG